MGAWRLRCVIEGELKEPAASKAEDQFVQRPGSKAATENRLPVRAAAAVTATCLMPLPPSCPQLLQLHWLMLRYVAPLIATLLLSIFPRTHTQKGTNWLATYHKSIL